MAGNSLALTFKIGVDPGDAAQQISGIRKLWNDLIAAGKQGFGEGVTKGAKDFETAAVGALQNVGRQLNQARSGLENLFRGDVLEGTVQLSRQFGVLAVGLGAIAVVGLGVKKSIEGILDVADKAATGSKDDFEAFQQSIARVGGEVTKLDRVLSSELLKSAGDVKSAFDNMFLKMLEKEGPALILLFQDVVKYINGPLTSAADTFASRQVEGIVQLLALDRAITAYFNLPSNLRTLDMLRTITPAYVAQIHRELQGLTTTLQNAAPPPFDPEKTKKARKDLTDAALEQAKAENALSLIKQQSTIADKQINEDQAKGLITQEEGAKRRLAVLAELQKAETAALDARQKAVETDPTLLQNQRTKQLADIETERTKLIVTQGEAQREESNKTIAADQKLHDAFTAGFAKLRGEWISYAEFLHKITDDIVKGLAQQGREIPGGFTHVLGLDDPNKIKTQLDIIHLHFTNFFEQLKTAFSAQGAAGLVQSLSDQLAKAIQELPLDLVRAFTDSFKTLLDVFIETGHTGPAVMKQFVAAVLRAIGTLASNFAALFFGLSIGYAALGDWVDAALFAAAGAALTLLAVGLGYAASKVAPSKASSAAGTGAGFGGDTTQQAPGTVTINQGAGSALGVQLQQLNALNSISNMLTTASPGDVVTRGAEQNPVAIGQANNEAARRDGTVSREFLQISGLRTA